MKERERERERERDRQKQAPRLLSIYKIWFPTLKRKKK